MAKLQAELSLPVLVTRVGACLCAVPLRHAAEVMRPLPVERLAGAPPAVLGLAIIRGHPTPVVALAALLDAGTEVAESLTDTARFITLRFDGRAVALVVDEVRDISTWPADELDALPPLWRGGPQSPAVAALGTRDRELLFVLETARLLGDDGHRRDSCDAT